MKRIQFVLNFNFDFYCRMCNYKAWLEHSKEVVQNANDEMSESREMRQSIGLNRKEVRNKVMAQQEFTNHLLRKRIFRTQTTQNELEWQIEKVSCE